jgi:hypothetical protein
VTQLVAAIRRVRRLVPAAAALTLAAHDYDHDPGKPACAWDDPQARDRLVSALVSDALAVLPAVAGAELDAGQAEAVGLLALVAGQDVEPGEQDGTWRIARKVPPDRVISVVDSEARHLHKSRSVYRDGYKAHLATEPETGLITAVALTQPTPRRAGRDRTACQGAARVGGAWRFGLRRRAGPYRAAGGRPPPDHQAYRLPRQHPGWVHQRRLHHRPPGAHRDLPSPTDRGHQSLRGGQVRAPLPLLPAALPLHHRQPWPHGAGLPVGSRAPAARRQATDPAFQASYRRWRPMVERSIAWLVAGGNRRVRYRGVARNQLWLSHRAAAINLRRLVTLGVTRDPTGWALT